MSTPYHKHYIRLRVDQVLALQVALLTSASEHRKKGYHALAREDMALYELCEDELRRIREAEEKANQFPKYCLACGSVDPCAHTMKDTPTTQEIIG